MAEVSVSMFSHFINLLRELSVNWGDHSSGEPEQHLVGEVKFLSKLRLSEDIRRSKSTDIQSFFFIPPRLVTHMSMQQKNQFQKIKFIVIKMEASDNIFFNQVRLSAQAQTTFKYFTPIRGWRKIQEDGRWRRRGSHAILHIFNHCHLAKYCDVYVCNLVCFLIYFPNPNIK